MITIPATPERKKEIYDYFTNVIGSTIEAKFEQFEGGDLDGFQGWAGHNQHSHVSWRMAFGGQFAYIEMVPQREETITALRFA